MTLGLFRRIQIDSLICLDYRSRQIRESNLAVYILLGIYVKNYTSIDIMVNLWLSHLLLVTLVYWNTVHNSSNSVQ